MFIVHISASGVNEVYLESISDLFEDLDLAAWPLIREDLRKLDRKLRKSTEQALELHKRDEAGR